MGGRSSTANQQQQETTQLSSDGIIAGDAFQGKTVTVNQDFPDTVAQAFSQLIAFAGNTVDVAGQAADKALNATTSSIDKVSDRTSFSENPEQQTLNRYLPFFMVAAVGATIYLLIQARK